MAFNLNLDRCLCSDCSDCSDCRLWLLVGSDRQTDRQCQLLSCPGQLKRLNSLKFMYFCWNIRLCVWTNKRGTVMSVRIFFNVSKIIPKRRDNFSLLRFQSTLQSINQSTQARSRWTPSYPNNNNMKLTRLPIVTEWKDNTESPNPPPLHRSVLLGRQV